MFQFSLLILQSGIIIDILGYLFVRNDATVINHRINLLNDVNIYYLDKYIH